MNDDETKATRAKEAGESITEKRARYERMRFVVCENGYVNVCNQSYNDDKAHTYSVEVENGEAVGCSCPHHQYRNSRCKHMVAVENAPLVVASASCASQTRMATDGGLPEITHHVEPRSVGGERYARCEGCGSESIHGATRILHDDDCLRSTQ